MTNAIHSRQEEEELRDDILDDSPREENGIAGVKEMAHNLGAISDL